LSRDSELTTSTKAISRYRKSA